MSRKRIVGLAVAIALVGCQPSLPTRPTGNRPAPIPVASRVPQSPAPVAPEQPLVPSTAPVVAPIISQNGAALAGTVKAPASLVSNNGGSVVTNGGGNLVGNNGGSYRIQAALTQVPVANAPVKVRDAAGKVLAEGKTGADGSYGFTSALPDQNLVVEVTLPDAKGTLQAIAPRGAKRADADLVSTLTTGYILDRFVKGQADPVATLDKLPADVEQATRAKAGAAFEGGTAAVPEALTTEKVVATVDQLRQQDKALDDQMETVKKLLIAAGQSDYGAGRVATTVSLGSVTDLSLGADGQPIFSSNANNRIWRLGADGKLYTLAGTGKAAEEAIAGKKAIDAALDKPVDSAVTLDGRLAFLDNDGRVFRIEADGTLAQLQTVAGQKATRLLGGQGDTVAVIAESQVLALSVGQGPQVLGTVPEEYQRPRRAAMDAQGRIYLQHSDGTEQWIYRLTPAGTWEKVAESLTRAEGMTIDDRANILHREPSGKLVVQKPDGTRTTLMESFPAWFWNMPFTLAPDGSAYVAQDWENQAYQSTSTAFNTILRIKDGKMSLVAGSAGAVAPHADDVALDAPKGTAFDAAGNLYIADTERVIKIAPDKAATYFMGPKLPNQSAKYDAPIEDAQTISLDAAGNLYIYDVDIEDTGTTTLRHPVCYKVTPAGVMSVVHKGVATKFGKPDLAVDKDGGVLYHLGGTTMYHLAPGASSPTTVNIGLTDYRLGRGPEGGFVILVAGRMRRWSPATGLDEGWALPLVFPSGVTNFSFGPTGRLFIGFTKGVLQELDLTTGKGKVIAGEGGQHFNGASVDDVIKKPYAPSFDGAGAMVFGDAETKQIKRVDAGQY